MTLNGFIGLAVGVLFAISFRLLPFVCFALLSRKTDTSDKVTTAIFFVGASSLVLSATSDSMAKLADVACIYAVWIAILFVLIKIWPFVHSSSIARTAMIFLGCTGWVLTPVMLSESDIVTGLVVVGVDGALSVASFMLGASSQVRWTSAAFFVLVDPNICVRQSARDVAAPQLSLGLMLRVLRGFTALAIGFIVLGSPAQVLPLLPQGEQTWAEALRFTTGSLAICVGMYAAHAGLADVQTAAMRSLGFAVAERYVHPFRALSPSDFWSRWNTYMAGWLRDHVYLPTAKALDRRVSRSVASDLAVLATFAASGCIHVGAQRAMEGATSARLFLFFVANGIAVVVWSRIQRFHASRGRVSSTRMYVGVSRTAFIAFIVTVVGVGFSV